MQLINKLFFVIKGFINYFLRRDLLLRQVNNVFNKNGFKIKRDKRILFFPMGYFEEAVLWEILLMKSINLRGYECKSFLCEGCVDVCEVFFFDSNNECKTCQNNTKRLFNNSNVPYLSSKKYEEAKTEKFKILLPDNLESLKKFTYDGVNFGEIVRVSLFHYLRRGTDDNTLIYIEIYKKFISSAIKLYNIQKAVIQDYKPDVIVVINGLFYPGALLINIAKKKNLRCITYERGYMVDRLVFSEGIPAVLFPVDNIWSKYSMVPLTKDQNIELDNYFNERILGSNSTIQLWDNPNLNLDSILLKYNICCKKKIFSLFTNILWDSAVIGCDIAFESMKEWIFETIKYFYNRNDCYLIIRIHPAEIKIPRQETQEKIMNLIYERFGCLPEHIVLIGPESQDSSYTILGISDYILVNTSIIGLEAACLGKEVIVVGKTHYRGKGFTRDILIKEDYFKLLDESIRNNTSNNAFIKDKARIYAYTFFFRYMIFFPFFKQENTKYNPVKLAIDSILDLSEGRNPDLDKICLFITEGKDLF